MVSALFSSRSAVEPSGYVTTARPVWLVATVSPLRMICSTATRAGLPLGCASVTRVERASRRADCAEADEVVRKSERTSAPHAPMHTQTRPTTPMAWRACDQAGARLSPDRGIGGHRYGAATAEGYREQSR